MILIAFKAYLFHREYDKGQNDDQLYCTNYHINPKSYINVSCVKKKRLIILH